MKNDMSIYQCAVCKNEIEALPARRIGCSKCNQLMVEVVTGIIKKGEDAPANEPESQGMLSNKNDVIKKKNKKHKK